MGRVTGFASQTLTHFVLLKIKSWEAAVPVFFGQLGQVQGQLVKTRRQR